MAEEKTYRPIKIVIPREEDYLKKDGGGSKRKIFDGFDPDLQVQLAENINEVFNYFEKSFSEWPDIPGVARVRLRTRAIAKSHRPINLFRKSGCPIIGNQEIGALLVRVTPNGLGNLKDNVLQASSHNDVANISTMTKIEPYNEKDVLGALALEHLIARVGQGIDKLKLRLFNHRDLRVNHKIQELLMGLINDLGLSINRLEYPWGIDIYRITDLSRDAIMPLVKFIGTQHLGLFPQFGLLTNASMPVRSATQADFPPPSPGDTYPIVGVIDTGVRHDDPLLVPWLEGIEVYVAGGDFSPEHGSFVCSLIANGCILNHRDQRFPGRGAKILSIAAVPPGGIAEDDLLYIIEQSLQNHPDVKVWNLSLSDSSTICGDDSFSTMAMKLDELQDRFGVTIVLPSGNFATIPLRSWPAVPMGEAKRIGENDRITSPADSVRALTVGSIAHRTAPSTCVNEEEPSPFSRRGPGPGFIFKPELTYFGGNCDINGSFSQVGVLALNDKGDIAEDIGTSYSTPLVAATLANVDYALVEEHTNNLVKALVIHSAVLHSPCDDYAEIRYKGFGYPQDADRLLGCNPWEATFVFEDAIGGPLRNPILKMEPFPIPACLVDQSGKTRGEFLITLVYNPPLDPSFGAEYCQTELDVSMGVYHPLSRDYSGQVPPVQTDFKKLYEKEQIKQAMKWYPVKGYYRHIPKGILGNEWSLRVGLTTRAEIELDIPQTFALIVTVRDPEKQLPVYDDSMAALHQNGWLSQDLHVRDQVRAKV